MVKKTKGKILKEVKEFFEPKMYNLNQFSEDEKILAKEFIKEAVLGFIELTINEKADEFFEKMARFSFSKDDKLTMTFTITTIGNDILAAIGAGRRQLRRKRKEKSNGTHRD